VALVTDGRMFSASGKFPAAIQVTAEAADNGFIGHIQDSDTISINAKASTLEIIVNLAARTAMEHDNAPNETGMGRELFSALRKEVGRAENGASIFQTNNNRRMSSMGATKLIEHISIVPVVVIEDKATAGGLAKCLRDAGVTAIEVTLRTPDALAAIEIIAKEVPEILVGAGSIRQTGQFEEIAKRGAQFAVSPGATTALIETAAANGMPFVRGAATASKMLSLYEHGYRLQKFFPAERLGSTKALSAPLPETRFCPTGGINAALASDYLALACVN
jgi:2-dehydro-3-deoxyphosphogluconate aldolase/(4S)-4-hydroxy-2-oxoglutarate aldolase